MVSATTYSFACSLPLTIEQARELTVELLKKEGFGIMSEINIAEKLHEKLSIDHEPHLILGACNPQLAHQALEDNRDVALVMPCNVVLRQVDDASTIVSTMLPQTLLKPFKGLKVQQSSCEAQERLSRVFDALSTHALQ